MASDWPGGSGEGAHTLAIAATMREQRTGTAVWLDRHLAAGAKVFYKVRSPGRVEGGRDWLLRPGGPLRAPVALATGQLEVMDLVEVARVAGDADEGCGSCRSPRWRAAWRRGGGGSRCRRRAPAGRWPTRRRSPSTCGRRAPPSTSPPGLR